MQQPFSGDFQERIDRLRAEMGDYTLSGCPLGLHDNPYPGPDGECEDCELQGLA
jgi:hypothetical protein